MSDAGQRAKLPDRLQGWLKAALAGGAIREDVQAYHDHWTRLLEEGAYGRFVTRHLWLLDALWQGLRSQPGGRVVAGPAFRYRLWRFAGYLWLDLLLAAEKQGWEDLPRLAGIVAGRAYLLEGADADCHHLCLELAQGHPARFEKLYEAKKGGPAWSVAGEARAGWRLLKRSPATRQWLSECAAQEGLRAEVLRVLQRVALAKQLKMRVSLRGLVKAAELPARVRQILERPQAMRWELTVLERKQAEGTLAPSAAGRIRNLRRYLAEREALERWVAEEAGKASLAEAPRERLRALARRLDEALGARWETVLGRRWHFLDDPGWDEALRLHHRAHSDLGLVKALVRHVVGEGRVWPLEHPANAAFERRMWPRRIDLDAWKGPLRMTFHFEGGRWEARAESDPPRIFETARQLGAARREADATIAEACEANKRVLCLRDRRGTLVGRKLIGLAPSLRGGAVLIGFRSYGAREPLKDPARPGDLIPVRVKLWFDLFCHEIALRIGARLAEPGEAKELCQGLDLFAKWSPEGVEAFDEWVPEAGAGGDLTAPWAFRRVEAALLRSQRRIPRAALIRGLLWLGANALPVLEKLDLEALGAAGRDFLQHHTNSIEVYRWLRRRR